MKKILHTVFFILVNVIAIAQRDTSVYDRKEEILHDGKRYRLYNNYLTFGFGTGASNIRNSDQSMIGIDYNFHIKRQYLQAGVLMSGNKFLSNNNVGTHLGIGYRRETEKSNFAVFGGPAYSFGVIDSKIVNNDTIPARIYDAFGVYADVQYIFKIAYDIGLGGEAFIEYNQTQMLGGVKLIFFFSGAYQGKQKLFNKHVKPKRKK